MALLAAFFVLAFAQSNEAFGPHGGSVVENSGHKFEVKFDSNASHVEVYTDASNKNRPKTLAITLVRDSGERQTFELAATNPSSMPARYQGELTPAAGSVIGAELRFPVSLKSFEILKFVPYIPKADDRYRN